MGFSDIISYLCVHIE